MLNTNHINNTSSCSFFVSQGVEESFKKQPPWKQGDVLQGTVLGYKEQKLQIDIEGNQVETLWEEREVPSKGTILFFQVEKTSKEGFLLRLYHNIKDKGKKEPIQGADPLQSSAPSFTPEKETIEMQEAEQNKKNQYVLNNVTQQDIKSLYDSSLNPEKMTLEELYHWVKHSPEETQGRDPFLEENQKWMEKWIEKKDFKTPSDLLKQAIAALMKEGLPITIKNVQSLVSARQRLESVAEMSTGKIAELTKKNSPPTLDAWYQHQYAGEGKGLSWKAQNPYEIWEESKAKEDPTFFNKEENWIQQEITRIFQGEKIKDTNENRTAAQHLIRAGIAITKENLQTLQQYQAYQNHIKRHPEYYLEQGAKQLKQGGTIGEISLVPTESTKDSRQPYVPYVSAEKIKEWVDFLPKITNHQLAQAIQKQQPLTLENIKAMPPFQEKEYTVRKEDWIPAKRQLLELQLKMTVEAAQKLGQKIPIDTTPLQQLVEELRTLEKETFSTQLQQVGVSPTEENIEIIHQVQQTRLMVHLTSHSLASEGIQVPREIGNDTLQIIGQKASQIYEDMATKPDLRFGETLGKVQDQIVHVLEQNGIQPTPAQVQGARILIENQLPITQENLVEIKIADQKLQTLIQGLHPIFVARMLKDQMNPMEYTIDELLHYMDTFEQWKGIDVKDRLSQYILEMDQEKILSPQQREGLIGVYRMLYTIKGSEGGALGYLYKNSLPLTLGNLMKAAQYMEKYQKVNQNQIDVQIDQQFGLLKEAKEAQNSIKQQIEKGFFAMEEITKGGWEQRLQEYELRLIRDFTKEASPTKIIEIVKDPHWREALVEDLKEGMLEERKGSISEDGAKIESPNGLQMKGEFLEDIKIFSFSLLERYDIPSTIQNLYRMTQMVQNPFYLGEKLNQLNQQVEQYLRTSIALPKLFRQPFEGVQDLQSQLETLKKEAISLPKKERQSLWEASKEVEQILQIQQKIQAKEGLYQIPIALHDGISQLNIYVLQDEKNKNVFQEEEEIRAWLSLHTTALGTIGMHVHIHRNKVQFQVYAEQGETLHYLQSQSAKLKQSLYQLGYQVSPILYGIQNIKQPLEQPKEFMIQFQQRKIGNGMFEIIG